MILLPLVFVYACATTSLDTKGVDRSITPARAKASDEHKGSKVLWGGMIIKTNVLKDSSQIEVLAYPVNENGVPKRSASAQGRFIIRKPGFLEPADYAQGKWLAVVGTVTDTAKGKVGEAEYIYPVINAEQLELIPDYSEGDQDPQFRFGVGIGIRF